MPKIKWIVLNQTSYYPSFEFFDSFHKASDAYTELFVQKNYDDEHIFLVECVVLAEQEKPYVPYVKPKKALPEGRTR